METLRVVQIELEEFFLKSKICSNLKRQVSKTARLTPRIFIFGTKISGEISANFWGKLSPSSVYVNEKCIFCFEAIFNKELLLRNER
jgi:hypothetical protein